ncbi:MAG: ATP-dependent DNA helicase RecG [Clostridiales Family XIII bacterium]|nr:ATP-dependent DNA helicase RecG [Clostridiales Family XIII bacterium]
MLNSPLTSLLGIGEKRAALLKSLGLSTLKDMLYYYPVRYEDRRKVSVISDAVDGEKLFTKATVLNITMPPYSGGRGRGGASNIPMKVKVSDDTGVMNLVFFNHRYLRNSFVLGREYIFYGTAVRDLSGISMVHPEFEAFKGEVQGQILPVYPLTAGVTQKLLRGISSEAVKYAEEAVDNLPREIAAAEGFASLGYSLKNIHYPVDGAAYRRASQRIIFEEFFLLRLALLWARAGRSENQVGIAFLPPEDRGLASEISDFESLLPFELTAAQTKVIGEIFEDMQKEMPMHRLVQGDVGSGKTAVAFAAIRKAFVCGWQSALMAPTEILAAQHFAEALKILGPTGMKIGFLSSGTTAAEKKRLLSELSCGTIDLLIGTHALIEDNVVFEKLGLVITDEQHRFGVTHRLRLRDKGNGGLPDVLIMTATPIPRSLAMIFYGDVDSSIIDELPPGRKPIQTRLIDKGRRNQAYDFARKQMAAGRQVYLVASAIEADEDSDYFDGSQINTVTELYGEMTKLFSDFNIGIMHGRMKSSEKDNVMQNFSEGKIDMLVSTTVIEVGISVSNATMMIVENSERFGLAQLHQLRGRVGRGDSASYCVLVNYGKSREAKDRGEILEKSNDGFEIAEKDLLLRGPGDVLGTRQSGLPELRLADFSLHAKIMDRAGQAAKALLLADSELSMPEHAGLRRKLDMLELIG